MKRLFWIVCIMMLGVNTFAQKEKKLLGVWRLDSVETYSNDKKMNGFLDKSGGYWGFESEKFMWSRAELYYVLDPITYKVMKDTLKLDDLNYYIESVDSERMILKLIEDKKGSFKKLFFSYLHSNEDICFRTGYDFSNRKHYVIDVEKGSIEYKYVTDSCFVYNHGVLIQKVVYREGWQSSNTYYYSNGQKSKETLTLPDGGDGIYKEWYENGNLKTSGVYLRNRKEGKWPEYDESGKLIRTITYSYGEEVERKEED